MRRRTPPMRGWARLAGVLCAGSAMLSLLILSSCGGGGSTGSPAPAIPSLSGSPAPAITSFSGSPATITAGTPVNLTGVFANGTGMIMPGSLSTTSGAAQTVTPGATTTYTLIVTNDSGTKVSQTATVTVVAAPAVPAITAPAYATAGSTGLVASVPAQAGSSYAWSISGGSITAGADTDQVTFTAGTAGTVQLGCVVTNAAGTASTPGAAVSTVVPAPAVPVISALADVLPAASGLVASVPAQPACTYVWTAVGGGITAGATSNQITYTAGSSGSVQLTCVVTNAAGLASAQGTATTTILALPVISAFTAANSPITSGTATTLSAVFTGGTGTIDKGIGSIDTGVAVPTGKLSASLTFTLTVTNTLGASVTSQVQVAVVPAPSITGFDAGTATISAGGTTSLTGSFTNGTGVITPGNLPVTSGVPATVSPAQNTTYTLTVTNSLNASVTSQVPVAVLPAPVITSFKAIPSSIVPGTASNLTAVFANGTGLIMPGGLVVTSGTPAVVTPSANTTYTLTVTDPLGATTSMTTAVTLKLPLPTISKFTLSPPSLGPGGTVTFSSSYANGTGVISAAGGPIAGNTDNPMVSTTYTLTVTNGDGAAVTATARAVVGSLAALVGIPSGIGNVDGKGNSARFYGPTSSAMDAAGNVFVADRFNNTIRWIAPDFTVTTIAGTPDVGGYLDSAGSGSPTQFNDPQGIALDLAGNLYVADTRNSVIRKITTTPGTIKPVTVTTFAPGTAFSGPEGVAVDGAGNVYVADTGNSIIRKITSGGGSVTTLFGGVAGKTGNSNVTGASTFNKPNSVAVDTAGANLYVSDTGNSLIRWCNLATGTVVTMAGGLGNNNSNNPTGIPNTPSTPTGSFLPTMGITVDTKGDVYFSDSSNQVIRTITGGVVSATTTGVVDTLVGQNTDSGYFDGWGAQFENNSTTNSLGGAWFNFPTGIALNPSGSTLVVSDFNNNTIRFVPITFPAGNNPIIPRNVQATPTTTIAGSHGHPGYSDVVDVNPVLFDGPSGITVDDLGNVFIADTTNQLIRKITSLGVVSTVAGAFDTSGISNTGAGTFNSPAAVAVDANPANATHGNLYVADSGNNAVRLISFPGGVAKVATLAIGFNEPMGIAVAANGDIYVADTFNSTIRKVTTAGAVSTVAGVALTTGYVDTTPSGPAPLFNVPFGVAVDNSSLASAGTIYVADTGNNVIRQISGGVVSTLAGSAGTAGFADVANGAGTSALFNHPDALVVDPATGYVYVADTNNQAIRRIVPGTGTGKVTVTTLVGVGGQGEIVPGILPASLAFPFGIAIDPTLGANPAGSLLITVNDAILTAPF